jgi:hypothetical protein
MDRDELLTTWEREKDRPAWIMEHADAINEHTDLSERVPVSSIYEVRQWMNSYKAVVTRQLREAAGESDTTEGDE